MPYPNFLVGELLHKGSELVILDAQDSTKPEGQSATPVNRGATGVVWKVRQAGVIERAVKILSPEKSLLEQDDWKYFVDVFEREMSKLASLTHSHLAKLISFGRIPPDEATAEETKSAGIPYIVMEYVEGLPLNEFITGLESRLQNDAFVNVVMDLLDDVLSALQYLHKQNAFHSDVKEMNILVRQAHRSEAVLVDMGAAHVFGDDHPDNTRYITTSSRVDKTWQKKAGKDIPSTTLNDNRIALDLYMFGAMLGLFLDRKLPEHWISNEWQPQVQKTLTRNFGNYGIVVLGRVVDKCLQYAYSSAEEVRQDLAAIRPRLISPFGIAELSLGTDSKTTLALPGDSVPLTRRITSVLNHPSVQRLRNISQLDFVSMIYLGATHTRLLHSVETYHLARRYIGTLLGDPIFTAYCAERSKLEATLLAALLHDIGHYPLGHMFEDFAFRGENSGPFAGILRDEKVTSALLDTSAPTDMWVRDAAELHISECKQILRTDTISSLPDLIGELFGERVLFFLRRILSDQADEDKGILILRSIINGPLDVDKVCYLRTDSRCSGASYGNAIDVDSIMASLTCTVNDRPGIAITEKGICAAETVATGRRWMFQRVYWHRTNRAMMAMIRFAPHYLFEHKMLTFSEYIKATYSISDIEAIKWLNEKFEKECKDNDFENPANMIIDGRRGIYKELLEFSPADVDEYERIRLYLMNRPCSEWNMIASKIAMLAKNRVPDAKMSDVLVDIPSAQRHRIGEINVNCIEKGHRKLSEMSDEFRCTQQFFAKGALSCRIFIHPALRNSLLKQKKLQIFREEVRDFLEESAPR